MKFVPALTVRRRVSALVALFLSLVGVSSLAAYEVQPLKIAIDNSELTRARPFVVNNTNAHDIALEIATYEIVSGDQTPTDDFVIFPPLASVAAGESQSFQLQYAGEAPSSVKEYNIVIEQLPIDFTRADNTTIKVGVNFVILVRVGPGATFEAPQD